MSQKRLTLIISGRVQGVSFRASTLEATGRLQITGFVRNLQDGRVEVVAEGNPGALADLEQWCHLGPPAAKVTSVETQSSAATGEFRDFQIR